MASIKGQTYGAIHPPAMKTATMRSGLYNTPVANRLYYDYGQTPLLVTQGQKVLKGEILAYDSANLASETIIASSSGTIVAIDQPHPKMHFANTTVANVPHLVLETDGNNQWRQRQVQKNWQNLSFEAVVKIVHKAGIVGMGGAGFSTAFKLNASRNIKHLVINAVECEPYICTDQQMLNHFAKKVVNGILLLQSILVQCEKVQLVLEDNMPDAVKALQTALKQCKANSIEIVQIPVQYPNGSEKQLIQLLTDREVKAGQYPESLGILVCNVATVKAIWEAVALDTPCVDRIITLAGDMLKINANFQVAIGTQVAALMKVGGFNQYFKNRVIAGGPLMGFALRSIQSPIKKINNCLLAPSQTELPLPEQEQPCIRCGECADVCPANLLPQQLYWHAKSKDYQQAEALNLFDCIECGACAFVCPSNIPLVQYYRHSKAILREQQAEKVKADIARQRFENRKLRLERLQAERQAKRQQRLQEVQALKNSEIAKAEPDQERQQRQLKTLQDNLALITIQLKQPDLNERQQLSLEAKAKNIQRRLDRIKI